MKWHNEDFWISDELPDVDMPTVHQMLEDTYWAKARPKERTARSVQKSICFSLKKQQEQVGFARVLTDGGCYAIVVDVVINVRFQRQGLGRWLMSVISSHPQFEGAVLILWTADQAEFYKACGLDHVSDFQVMRKAPLWMTDSSMPPPASTRDA